MSNKRKKNFGLVMNVEETKDKFRQALNELMDYENDYINLIKVNWIDAHSIIDTITLKEARQEKLVDVVSIGYLIDEDDDCIKICSFIFLSKDSDIQDPKGDTGFRNVQIIPKSQIKSILILKIDWEASKKLRQKNEK